MAIHKDLSRYYEMENDKRLDERHRLAIRSFNRLVNGRDGKPGLRNIVVGRELERVATSALIGLYSVSDPNPGFTHFERQQDGNDFLEKKVVTESVLVAGNILLTGLPGGGKTLMARSLAAICGLTFDHVQMTPDMTPRDLIATTTLEGNNTYTYLGPVFSHVLLADEINRATPKTQSALMQRMSSGEVTYKELGKRITKVLPKPCFTIATRNPIEQAGTYLLPEAQLDRFLYNIHLPLPSDETLDAVLMYVPGLGRLMIEPLTSADEILDCRDFIFGNIEVSDDVRKYIRRLITATYNPFAYGLFPELKRELAGGDFIQLPPNSRAALHLMNSSKTIACIDGKREVEQRHVKKRFYEVVNHRFVINKSAHGLLARYGGVDKFLELMIKGNPAKKILGILDVVPFGE